MIPTFKAHRWLRNRHVQTCLPTLLSRLQPLLPFMMEKIYLPDGDVIELGRLGPQDAPCVLLMPGLEGDITSPYIQFVAKALSEHGWQVLVMHYRTCGQTVNLQPKSYNAYCSLDLAFLLQDIQSRFHLQPHYTVGFSMGGNLLLHYSRKHPQAFKKIITISTPFDMDETAKHLPRFYEKRFVIKFKEKMLKKLKAGILLPVNEKQIKKIRSLREYDELITAPLFGHDDAQSYYQHSSCVPFLGDITTPTHMIFSQDDPFIPIHTIPRDFNSPHVTLEMHQEGGHIGFLTHKNHAQTNRFWLAQRIVQLLPSPRNHSISRCI
jgi:predicted alpha/beta-fold hydrolase